jgi:hypothetical protein
MDRVAQLAEIERLADKLIAAGDAAWSAIEAYAPRDEADQQALDHAVRRLTEHRQRSTSEWSREAQAQIEKIDAGIAELRAFEGAKAAETKRPALRDQIVGAIAKETAKAEQAEIERQRVAEQRAAEREQAEREAVIEKAAQQAQRLARAKRRRRPYAFVPYRPGPAR